MVATSTLNVIMDPLAPTTTKMESILASNREADLSPFYLHPAAYRTKKGAEAYKEQDPVLKLKKLYGRKEHY